MDGHEEKYFLNSLKMIQNFCNCRKINYSFNKENEKYSTKYFKFQNYDFLCLCSYIVILFNILILNKIVCYVLLINIHRAECYILTSILILKLYLYEFMLPNNSIN